MVNANRPSGLAPVKHLNGMTWNGQVNMYVVLSTNGSVFGIGSLVKSFAGGDANGVPAIALAAASDTVRGVIVGIVPLQATDPVGPIPATKTRNYYVLVCDDPTVVYEAQFDNSSTFSTASLNKNCNFTVGAPSGISPFATTVLTGAATTQALPLKLLGKVQRPDVDLSANTRMLVMVNQHELMGNTAGL
jgi:hypothetical protein